MTETLNTPSTDSSILGLRPAFPSPGQEGSGQLFDPNTFGAVPVSSDSEDGTINRGNGLTQDPKKPREENQATNFTEVDENDKDLRYEDTQQFGISFAFVRAMLEARAKGLKNWQLAKAMLLNGVETPVIVVHRSVYRSALKRFNLQSERLTNAQNDRLRELRQATLDQTKTRVDRLGTTLNERVERMPKRIASVYETADRRRQEHIAELRARREEALGRKAVRHQLCLEGASRSEAKEIIKNIDKDRAASIGRIAIVAETSRQLFSKADTIHNHVTESIDNTERRLATADDEVKAREIIAQKCSYRLQQIDTINLPRAIAYAEGLRMKLAQLEKTDPYRATLKLEIKQADSVVNQYERKRSFWQKMERDALKSATNPRARRDNLRNKRQGLDNTAQRTVVEANAKKQMYDTHQSSLYEALADTLNN